MPLGFYVFFPETSCRLIEMYINDVSFITRLKNVKPMHADTAVCGMPIYIIHKIKYIFFQVNMISTLAIIVVEFGAKLLNSDRIIKEME